VVLDRVVANAYSVVKFTQYSIAIKPGQYIWVGPYSVLEPDVFGYVFCQSIDRGTTKIASDNAKMMELAELLLKLRGIQP
jgi:hypothetical protein